MLLHEGLGCVATWKDFPEKLAQKTELGVLVYSRSGYGRSSPITLPRPLDFHSREALEVLPSVLERMNVDEYFLLGHSDGASIAIIYAGSKPRLNLKGLILLSPHLATEEKCVHQIQKAASSYNSGKLRMQLRKYHGDNTDCAFLGWSGVWLNRLFIDWNIEEYLPGINRPLLTFRGADDPYNTPWHVETIRQTVSGSVVHYELQGSGHSPHVDASEIVMNSIGDFVKAYE